MPVDGKGPLSSYGNRIFTCCAPGSCHQTAFSPLFHIHSSGELHGKAGSGHVVIMISVTFAWGGPRRVSEQSRARRGMRPILQAGKRVRRPMPLRKDAIRREVLTFEPSLSGGKNDFFWNLETLGRWWDLASSSITFSARVSTWVYSLIISSTTCGYVCSFSGCPIKSLQEKFALLITPNKQTNKTGVNNKT